MIIYLPNYDTDEVESKDVGDIGNLEAFNREMSELFDEWYSSEEECLQALRESYNEED